MARLLQTSSHTINALRERLAYARFTPFLLFAQVAAMPGWVSIERDLFKHPFFGRQVMSEREAWIWMICHAAWADTSHATGGVVFPVPRGSFVCTLRELQVVWGWGSDARVRGWLDRLESQRMVQRTINAAGNAKKTHITICNYDAFQVDQRTNNAPINAQLTHRSTQEKNKDKQTNNTEAIASVAPQAKKRGSRLPDDWYLPKAWGDWAVSEGWHVDQIRLQADQFGDYWRSATGSAATKLDWEATWRIWMRKTPKGQMNGKRTGDDRDDPTLRIIANAARMR